MTVARAAAFPAAGPAAWRSAELPVWQGGPPFAPTALAGLNRWYPVSALTEADDAVPATLPDFSGNGNDATKYGSGAIKTRAEGGRYIDLDGVGDGFTMPATPSASAGDVWIVAAADFTTGEHSLIGCTEDLNHIIGWNQNSRLRIRTGAVDNYPDSGAIPHRGFNVYRITLSGGVATVYMNLEQVVQITGAYDFSAFTFIGARRPTGGGNAEFWDGGFAELAWYSRALGDAEADQLWAYYADWLPRLYIDAASGNDANDGRTAATAWAGFANQSTYGHFGPATFVLLDDTQLRLSGALTPLAGVSAAYPVTLRRSGDGTQRPILMNSVAVTGWENAGGENNEEWKVTGEAEPASNGSLTDGVFLWATPGDLTTVTRLVENDGAEGSLAQGEWAWSAADSGTLTLRLPDGSDPTGQRIEKQNAAAAGVAYNVAGGHAVIDGVDTAFNSDKGFDVSSTATLIVRNAKAAYVGNDCFSTAASGRIECYDVVGINPLEEGISLHGTSSGLIDGFRFEDCGDPGINSLPSTDLIARNGIIKNCYGGIEWAPSVVFGGSLLVENVVVIAGPDSASAVKLDSTDTETTLRNVTVYNDGSSVAAAVQVVGGTVELRNVAMAGFDVGIDLDGGTLDHDYSGFYDIATKYQGTSAGAHDVTDTEGLVDPANEDFAPAAGSLLIDAGVAIAGLTTDLDGKPRSDPPDIGAVEAAA